MSLALAPWLLPVVLASCASVAPAASQSNAPAARNAPSDPFPPPAQGLAIRAPNSEGAGPTLDELLRGFGRATGNQILVAKSSVELLKHTPVGLLDAVELPPERVYPFVEAVLRQNGYALSLIDAHAPRLLALIDMSSGRSQPPNPRVWSVPAEQLEGYALHPALLIQTTLELPHTDVRQLANSLRSVQGGNSFLQIINAGSTGQVLLSGTAGEVWDCARMLLDMDAREGKRTPPPEVKPESKAGKSEGASEG